VLPCCEILTKAFGYPLPQIEVDKLKNLKERLDEVMLTTGVQPMNNNNISK